MFNLSDSKFYNACCNGDIEAAKTELEKIVGMPYYRPIIESSFLMAFRKGKNDICEWISTLHPRFVFERRGPGFTSARVDSSKEF